MKLRSGRQANYVNFVEKLKLSAKSKLINNKPANKVKRTNEVKKTLRGVERIKHRNHVYAQEAQLDAVVRAIVSNLIDAVVNSERERDEHSDSDQAMSESNDVQQQQTNELNEPSTSSDNRNANNLPSNNSTENPQNQENSLVYGPHGNDEFSEEEEVEEEEEIEETIVVRKKMGDFVRKPDVLQVEGNLSENWRKFKRNFDIYMEASELKEKADPIKVNVFLNIIGSEAVEIYDTLNLDANLQNDYNAVIKAFDDFCKPKTNPVYERFVFSQRVQKEGESFDSFHVDIKRLIKNCAFGDKEKEMLRDRIVIGVSNKNLQKKLLELADLTYDTAVEKCKASEATQGQAEEMNKSTATVHEVKQSNGTSNNNNNAQQKHVSFQKKRQYEKKRGWQSQQQQQHNRQQQQQNRQQNGKMSNNFDRNLPNCRFCNYKHKLGSSNCPAYGKDCGNCGKSNHFKSVCRVKNVQSINAHDFDNISNMYIHSLTQVADCSANTTNIEHKPVWIENVNINEKFVSFKVDTGSDVTVLPKRLLDMIAPGCSLYQSKTVLRAFGGSIVRPIGTCVLHGFLKGKRRKIEIEIVDFDAVPLLGLTACIEFGLVDIRQLRNRRMNFLGH